MIDQLSPVLWSNRRPSASPLLSFGQALLEDEPIDGLDILGIEPHLITQTILDTQDDAGDITITRDVLAGMLSDLDSIGDEGASMAFPTHDHCVHSGL